ncbi:hypothetical protein [Streptomyces mirabilis]
MTPTVSARSQDVGVRGLPGAGEDAAHERCAVVTDEFTSAAAAPCAPTHRGLVGEVAEERCTGGSA